MSELSDFAQKIGGMSSQPADLFIKFKIFYLNLYNSDSHN